MRRIIVEVDQRLAGGAQALVILAEPALLALPSERSLHHPPAREHPEARRRQILGPVDLVIGQIIEDPDFGGPPSMRHDLGASSPRSARSSLCPFPLPL